METNQLQGGYDDVVQLSKLGSEGNVGYFIDVGFNEMFNLSSGVNSFEDFMILRIMVILLEVKAMTSF